MSYFVISASQAKLLAEDLLMAIDGVEITHERTEGELVHREVGCVHRIVYKDWNRDDGSHGPWGLVLRIFENDSIGDYNADNS